MSHVPSDLSLGARPRRDRSTEFRVWAPERFGVEVLLDGPRGPIAHGLHREVGGTWAAKVTGVPTGTRYRYRFDRRDDQVFPDPASRWQPDGVHGASVVVDPELFRWSDADWRPPARDEFVFYELHTGTFSPEGTFAGVTARLPQLAALGVTAIELMPVAAFPGRWNWGYDGASLFAPSAAYGTPEDLRALVDVAHRHRLAVILDVVYNHFGPDGAYAAASTRHFFTDRHQSPWGPGINLDGPESAGVRRFFVENAVHWIREYHFDGLRLDATHALQDNSERHFLQELATSLHAASSRPVIVIAEDDRNLNTLVRDVDSGGWGLDAVWADDLHHQLRVHTAGDRDGYYADYHGRAHEIAATLRQGWFYTGQWSQFRNQPRGTPPTGIDWSQFVVCLQNHDQVGNRADGARLTRAVDPAVYRALTVLLLAAPELPLLFMGQEWAATTPFLYFTDHAEPLGRQVSEGRRAEFSRFDEFSNPSARTRIPDPQAEATFTRSRLDWEEMARPPHAGVYRLYQRLLAWRRTRRRPARDTFIVTALDAHTVALAAPGVEGWLVIVRLDGDGVVQWPDIRLSARTVRISTEDGEVTDDSQPVHREPGDVPVFRFARPGAVVLTGTVTAPGRPMPRAGAP